jgi:hypothetical protein
MNAEEKITEYLRRADGKCLLRFRFATESGLLGPDSPANDYPFAAMVAHNGSFGFWGPGSWDRPHFIKIVDATEDVDELTIDGTTGNGSPIQAILSPIWQDEQWRLLKDLEDVLNNVAAIAEMKEMMSGSLWPVEEKPKAGRRRRSFMTSELRKPDQGGVYRLIGVMVVSKTRGTFRPNLGFEHHSREWNGRIDYCLGQGTSLYDLLDYLFTRSNGITLSWSRPEPVKDFDLEAASMKALLIARERYAGPWSADDEGQLSR